MNIITIAPMENGERDYLAFYKSNFLQCVYSVSFKDTIVGAIALNRFTEMIKTVTQKKNIEYYLSDKKVRFRSQAVIDAVTGKMKEDNQ